MCVQRHKEVSHSTDIWTINSLLQWPVSKHNSIKGKSSRYRILVCKFHKSKSCWLRLVTCHSHKFDFSNLLKEFKQLICCCSLERVEELSWSKIYNENHLSNIFDSLRATDFGMISQHYYKGDMNLVMLHFKT